jgi:hypothetical protein
VDYSVSPRFYQADGGTSAFVTLFCPEFEEPVQNFPQAIQWLLAAGDVSEDGLTIAGSSYPWSWSFTRD